MLDLSAKLAKAVEIIRSTAESECDCCDAGEPLWHPADQEGELWHGYGEAIGQCDSRTMDAAWRAGVIEIPVLLRCPEGHDWYGEGCPECHPEAGE